MTTQISLSLELMCLINWLVKNEKTLLNSLVKQAVAHGLIDELQQLDQVDPQHAADELYLTIFDFLDHLEQALIKNLETVQVDIKTKDAILPSLQKIEGSSLDFKTMWQSMQQTKARISKKNANSLTPHIKNPKDILFEEILKNWKPNKKETIN